MGSFILTDKGAVIEITNNSTEKTIYAKNEGFISPTLSEQVVESEVVPAYTIYIPSFVTYKVNSIAPGETISFVTTRPDEVYYYLDLANSKLDDIEITVTPVTETIILQDKTIPPTTEEQIVTADDGYTGLGTVTVEAVTASIDENITAENIKKDVEILGVTGSYEGSGGSGNATLETADTEFDYVNNYKSLLTSIEIPDGVTSIGTNAFFHCSSLTSITIPNSVISIGEYAFSGCSALISATIGNSVTSIGDNAFSDCSALTSITIPNSVTSIGVSAFFNCSALTSITIPNSVTSIENNAFSGCSSLTSITIPNSVTSIGVNAFFRCSSLTSATIGNLVEDIGDSAFFYCSALTSITIPNSVTSIGDSAFGYCNALSVVEFLPTTPPEIQSGTFYNLPTNCTIYVPNGTLSDYTSASNYPDPSTYTYIERPAT